MKSLNSVKIIGQNNPEMSDIRCAVEGYHKDREQGLEGIRYTAQPFWYCNHLAKTAMEEAGVTLKETFKLSRGDKNEYEMAVCTQNGNHTKIQYDRGFVKRKTYYKGQHKMLSVRSALTEDYILGDTKRVNSKTAYCEKCGALNRMTADYKGCAYCGTPMRMHELRKKIVSVRTDIDAKTYLRLIVGCMVTFVFLAMFITTLRGLIVDYDFSGVLGIAGACLLSVLFAGFISAVTGGFMGILVADIVLLPICCAIMGADNKILKLGKVIRKEDPEFSDTEFYGTVQAYVKAWLLARDRKQLGYMSDTDSYSDNKVIDADCLALKQYAIRQNEAFRYIDLVLKVRLISLDGDRLLPSTRKVKATVKRKRGAISSLFTETFTCRCCGAAVDIFKGNTCLYCGNTVNAADTNWVLDNAEII